MRRESTGELLAQIGVIGAFLVVGGVAARGCAEIAEEPRDEVIEFIEDSGFSNVEITDIDKLPNPAVTMGGCGEDDQVKYEFRAISDSTGNVVDRIVCDGLFKGMTIRG